MKRCPSSFLVVAAVCTVAGAAALAACKASPDQGGIQIITGGDDPFTGPPAATTLNVDGISADGGVVSLVKGEPVAQETLDLGNYDETLTYALRVTAFSADGGAVALGESLPIELGALDEEVLPIFMQRKGVMALMPDTLDDGRQMPLVGILGGRYIFEAGGTDTSSDAGTSLDTNLYDLLEYDPYVDPPTFATTPTSMAISDLVVVAINANGATLLDLSTGDFTTATVPTGSATWADVAGGQSFLGDDGTVYVVGATRDVSLGTSAAVLVVSTSQTLSWATLQTARAGAAAGWVSGKGLVIAGGSATGAGVELLGAGATSATPLPYPPDSTTGGGIDALDASDALLVAGTTARVINLDCGTAATCVEQTWTPTLPAALTFAQVFDIDASSVFIVGDEADGSTHAFTFSTAAATELPLRIARTHARAVRLPLGPVAVLGGGSAQIESFTP